MPPPARWALQHLWLTEPLVRRRLAASPATAGAAIRQIFSDTVVAPGLVLAATDARHYRPLADAAYGFVPIRFGPEDLRPIHGIDERIAVADYADTIRFYAALILGATGR